MKLENTFTIAAPIDKAWEVMNNPEAVAPCFPGATLTASTGDSFTGTVKVKLGPISLTYKGKGVYLERDEASHTVVLDASGRDSRGNGTAKATVTGTMTADGPDATAVTMVTDMTITGRPAQFGRGVISDVADKIITQFASRLAQQLHGNQDPETPEHSGEQLAATGIADTRGGATTGAKPIVSAPEPINLFDAAGVPVAKRLVVVAAVLGALAAIVMILQRQCSA